ncbi:MAG: CDP-alcohol phosphatidyltransferase family protein [Candidatus Hadarchaeum sp.]
MEVDMLSRVRERVKDLIAPVAQLFARSGLSPNALTLLGLVFGIIAALLFALGEQLLAGVVLLVAGFFDIIDGAVARLLQKETAFGGVLDSVVDRYVDFLLYAGIIYALIHHRIAEPEIMLGWGWLWGLLAIAGSFMVSYTRARAEAAGSGRLDVGFAERAERLIILAIGALLSLTLYAVVIIAVIANLTAVQRMLVTRQRLH